MERPLGLTVPFNVAEARVIEDAPEVDTVEGGNVTVRVTSSMRKAVSFEKSVVARKYI